MVTVAKPLVRRGSREPMLILWLTAVFTIYHQFFAEEAPLHIREPDPFDSKFLVASPVDLQSTVAKTVYHSYKPDESSGDVLEDMLMCHAYIWNKNQTYGGACGDLDRKAVQHQTLIDALGLHKHIEFACPGDHAKVENRPTRRSVIQTLRCRKEDTKIWTPEYVDWLREQIEYPTRNDNRHTIAVHIRRDDVTPCMEAREGYYDQYLPNSYYHKLIDEAMKPNARVVIYSQKNSYESLESFKEKGYEVYTDSHPNDSWKSMMNADVLILSKSSFSVVPGLLNRGKVIYAPFWHYPLKHWTMPALDLLDRTNGELARMKLKCNKRPAHK